MTQGGVTQEHLEGFIFKKDSPLCLENAISDPWNMGRKWPRALSKALRT